MATPIQFKAPAPAPAPPKPRPYRDYFTPALHRRFTSAALLSLSICYISGIWIGSWDPIWSWFPLGPAGLRTLALFVSVLAVFVLRVASMRVGARTTTYPFETFAQCALSVSTWQTLFWYAFATWWFAEMYIWFAPASSRLGLVDQGKSYERPRLNERPVIVRFMFLIIAVAQTLLHVWEDYDQIRLPKKDDSKKLDAKATTNSSPRTRLTQGLPELLTTTVVLSITTLVSGTLLYFIFFRQLLWSISYAVVRNMASLPKSSVKPGPIYMAADIFGRLTVMTFIAFFLLNFSCLAFDAYIAQEPLKANNPLTSDSKDPNGSLLNGLKAKKEIVRSFAFQELFLITSRFDDRRKTIYTEIDRKPQPTWTQVLTLCLAELQAIRTRIQTCNAPPTVTTNPVQPANINSLPKIAPPLRDENIFNTYPRAQKPSAIEQVGDFAKSIGQSPGKAINPLESAAPQAQKLLQYGERKLLTDGQRASIEPTNLRSEATGLVLTFLKSSVGWPFRMTFGRTAIAVVHGAPVSRKGVLHDAVKALSALATRSLKEDRYGNVAKDVPTIIRTFHATIVSIESFLQSELQPSWTDVEFDQQMSRRVPEVEQTLEVLRDGLEEIMRSFQEFSGAIGLKLNEIREVKECLASKPKAIEAPQQGDKEKPNDVPAESRQDRPAREMEERRR